MGSVRKIYEYDFLFNGFSNSAMTSKYDVMPFLTLVENGTIHVVSYFFGFPLPTTLEFMGDRILILHIPSIIFTNQMLSRLLKKLILNIFILLHGC